MTTTARTTWIAKRDGTVTIKGDDSLKPVEFSDFALRYWTAPVAIKSAITTGEAVRWPFLCCYEPGRIHGVSYWLGNPQAKCYLVDCENKTIRGKGSWKYISARARKLNREYWENQ